MDNLYDCVKCHACCLGMPLAIYTEEQYAVEGELWRYRGFTIQKIDKLYYVLSEPCLFLKETGECAIYDTRPKICDLYAQGCESCLLMRKLKEMRGMK